MAPGKQFPLAVVITGVDRFTAPLTRVNDRLAKLTAPARAFQTSLRKFGEETGLSKLGDQASRVRERLGGVVEQTRRLGKELLIGGSIGGFAVGEFFKRGIDRGADLGRQSKQLGMSADSLKRYQYIAGHAGIEQETLNDSLDTFNKSLGQARMRRGKMYEALLPAPHTLRELVTAKDTAAALEVVLRKMHEIPGARERAVFSAAIFANVDMARLNMTREEIDSLTARYREIYGPQEAFAQGAEDAQRAMRDTTDAIEGASNAFLGPFFKGLTSGSEGLTKFLVGHRAEFTAWGQQLAPKVRDFALKLPERLERIASFFGKLYRAARPFADLVGGMPNLALLIGGGILLAPLITSVGQLTGALITLGGRALWAGGLLRYALSGGAGAAGAAGGAAAGAAEGAGAAVAGAAGATGAGGAAAFGLGAMLPLGIVAAAASVYGYVLLPRLIAGLTPAEIAPGHVAHGPGQESAAMRDFFQRASVPPVLPPNLQPGFNFGRMSREDTAVRPFASHFGAALLSPSPLLEADLGALGRRAVSVDLSDDSIRRLAEELHDRGNQIAPVKSHVSVEFRNAPRGTRVRTDSAAPIETLMGFTMAEAH